jgi:hypothetical protein
MGRARVTQAAILVLDKRRNTACLYAMVVVSFGFNVRERDTRRVERGSMLSSTDTYTCNPHILHMRFRPTGSHNRCDMADLQ